jgi:hypothetical protein
LQQVGRIVIEILKIVQTQTFVLRVVQKSDVRVYLQELWIQLRTRKLKAIWKCSRISRFHPQPPSLADHPTPLCSIA